VYKTTSKDLIEDVPSGTNLFKPAGREMLTIVYSYYNSIKAVEIQVDNWSQYPIELMKKLHFILIDDCSDSKANLKINFPINLTLLRVTDNIPWNQPGAKNLGFKFAKTD
jgi:hypothetical protein